MMGMMKTGMRSRRRTIAGVAALLALALLPSCSYLRDKEPWTVTVIYTIAADGRLVANTGEVNEDGLAVIRADANHGRVQVVNQTPTKFGFAVRELAVFEEVPPDYTMNVDVDEAKDGESYLFEDHINDQVLGVIVVKYLSDEFRR